MVDKGIHRDQFFHPNDSLTDKTLLLTQFVVDNAVDGICWVGFDGRFRYVNNALCKKLGYTREELLALTVQNIDKTLGKESWAANWKEIKRLGHRRIESLLRTKDGSDIPVDLTINHVVFDGEEYHCCFVRDTSERKRSEETFRSFTENALTGIYAIQDNVLTYVNAKFAEIFGYRIDECLNKATVDMLVHPADLAMVKESVRKRLMGEIEDAHYEFRGIKKAGEVINLEVYGSRGICNGRRCVIGTVLDITGRKRLEEELRLHGKIAEELTEGVLFVSPGGVIVYANSKLEKLFGYGPGELRGKNVSILNGPTDKDPQERADEISGLVNEKGVWSGEIENIKKDGTPFWCYASVSTFEHHEYGRIAISIHTDITDRKKAEGRLRDSEEKTRQLAEELKMLHEQLLNLTMHLQAVREKERIDIAREIHDELGQVLIAFKLNLSWIGKKLSEYDKGLFKVLNEKMNDVDNVIKSINRMCMELRPSLLDNFGLLPSIEWKAGEFQRESGIVCEIVSEQHAAACIDTDMATALFRIFEIALSNISQHADASKVKISLKERNNRLILEITDNGIGITENQMSKPRSFGILRMREYIHPWRGDVKITSAKGTGTTVTATIPYMQKTH